MKGREFKRVWGKPWDYGFLLKLEQYKIREMCEYFKKSQLTVGWELQVRDLTICDKLISIILEEDRHYRGWLDTCYGGIKRLQIPFTVYVNTKNYKRFMPTVEDFHQDNLVLHNGMLISLRQQKALFLYNKIRAYRMERWWN